MNKDDYRFFFGVMLAIPVGLLIFIASIAGLGWFWDNVVTPAMERLA